MSNSASQHVGIDKTQPRRLEMREIDPGPARSIGSGNRYHHRPIVERQVHLFCFFPAHYLLRLPREIGAE